MTHYQYAALSGLLVAVAWTFLDPLSLGEVGAASAGFVLGVASYAMWVGLSALDDRRAAT